MKKAFLSFMVLGLVFSTAASALAGHKPGHREPPSCDNPNPGPNSKHCYPPPAQSEPAACNKPNPPPNNPNCRPASFSTETPRETGPAVTVGMLLAATALGGGFLFVRRRWTGWLSRS